MGHGVVKVSNGERLDASYLYFSGVARPLADHEDVQKFWAEREYGASLPYETDWGLEVVVSRILLGEQLVGPVERGIQRQDLVDLGTLCVGGVINGRTFPGLVEQGNSCAVIDLRCTTTLGSPQLPGYFVAMRV